MDYKIVIGSKNGKSIQKELKSPEADALHKKKIGDKISGDEIGLSGYEFEITGGSDKCGFPMRKGIQQPRKKVSIGESVGFSGNKRFLNKKKNLRKQKGLLRRRTVCGERVTGIINQVNLKVLKEGDKPLDAAPAAEGETPKEAEKAPVASEAESKSEEQKSTAQPAPEEAKVEKKEEKSEPAEEPKVEGEAEGNPEVTLSDKEKDQPKEEPKEEEPSK